MQMHLVSALKSSEYWPLSQQLQAADHKKSIKVQVISARFPALTPANPLEYLEHQSDHHLGFTSFPTLNCVNGSGCATSCWQSNYPLVLGSG